MRAAKRVNIVYWVGEIRISRSVLKKNAGAWIKKLKKSGATRIKKEAYRPEVEDG